MAEKARRGTLLTICAVLFAVLAVSNSLKPLQIGDSTGFVFLGTRLTGTPNLILGTLFGVYLAVYALGIFRMRRFALGMAYFYTLYVIINLVMWRIRATDPTNPLFGIVYILVAVGVSSGAVFLLTRRKADLT